MEKVFEIYIRTTPSGCWEAITNPRSGPSTTSAPGVTSDWTPGARLEEIDDPHAEGLLGEGEVLWWTVPLRLVHTMVALSGEDVNRRARSRVTWEIKPIGDSCVHLRVTHDEMHEAANEQLYGGWPMILSGLEDVAQDRPAAHHAGSLMYQT